MSRNNLVNKNTYLYVDIGKRIKEFAEEKHGGLSNLAKIINVSLQNLSQYVTGRNSPGKKFLLRLNEAGCDINWLLTGEKTEYTEEGFNKLVVECTKYAGLTDVDKLKRENEQLRKENAELKKEREKVLKMLNK